jgi:hypothetical protein
MGGRSKNLLALVGGLVFGFVLLELGLAIIGGVHRDFAPVKATLELEGGMLALCYVPGSDLEFPLDMRVPDDRAEVEGIALDWRVGHAEKWSLDSLLERYSHCLTFSANRGSKGTHPKRGKTVLVLGDSFAYGEGLPARETLWAHLGAAQSEANVVSFAARGAHLEEVLRQAQAALASPAPPEGRLDRAIYFWNLNDVVEQPPDDSQGPVSSEMYLAAVDDALYLMERWGPHNRFEQLAALTRTWWALRQRAARAWVSERTSTLYRALYLEDSNALGRARTLVLLRSLRDMFATRGVALDIVLYPLLVEDEDGSYPFAPLNAVVLDWCIAEGLNCHDGTSAILEAGPLDELIVHPRDRHPNGRANAAMARYVVENVLR